jgi:hypothetical protein
VSQRNQQMHEDMKAAAKPALPGLDLKAALQSVRSELRQAGTHGAHELAAALFNGNAFVMYPRGGKEDNAASQEKGHGLPQEADKSHQRDEQSRGGMSM